MASNLQSTSLRDTTIDQLMQPNLALRCVVGIEVENWTKWSMTRPSTFYERGYVITPPLDLYPGHKEAMVAVKASGSPYGSWGSVSWKIKMSDNPPEQDRRVVVMWCNPFNYNHYVNTLAVGITEPGHGSPEEGWTKMMYEKEQCSGIRFSNGEFYNNVQQIQIEDGMLEVTGIMSSTHHAKVHVAVRPLKNANFHAALGVGPGIMQAHEGEG